MFYSPIGLSNLCVMHNCVLTVYVSFRGHRHTQSHSTRPLFLFIYLDYCQSYVVDKED
jgi:hypothetical protein